MRPAPRRLPSVAVACLLAALAAPAAAEIYQWTDESGRVHFTQNLGQVPPRYRAEAEARADKQSSSPSKVQTYSSGGSPALSRRPAPASRAPSGGVGETYYIRVSQAGTSMLVNVRLNNSVTAPFLLDTGASDVLVPEAVARQLGLDLSGARTKRYSTANGMVEHPVVMLRTVALGDAVVEDVPASVSPHMSVGLLGLSFFNHFNYNIDAANGVVTLTRNALASKGAIRGGRSEAQWQAEFRGIRYRIARAEAEYSGKAESRGRERRRLEGEIQELARQLDLLEEEADRARVPMAWRD